MPMSACPTACAAATFRSLCSAAHGQRSGRGSQAPKRSHRRHAGFPAGPNPDAGHSSSFGAAGELGVFQATFKFRTSRHVVASVYPVTFSVRRIFSWAADAVKARAAARARTPRRFIGAVSFHPPIFRPFGAGPPAIACQSAAFQRQIRHNPCALPYRMPLSPSQTASDRRRRRPLRKKKRLGSVFQSAFRT